MPDFPELVPDPNSRRGRARTHWHIREGGEDRVLDGLAPNTVELIPTLGALFPRGGPVQDPVLTLGVFVSWA